MKEHGCDTVILAITEFDIDFCFPNINNIVKTAHKDEKELLDRLLKNGQKQRDAETSISKKELAKAFKRQKELDTMFAKLYEDHAMGRIDERNYDMLRERYQDEQRGLDEKIVIHQGVTSPDGFKDQEVEIFYRFIGKIEF